jgi:site-specific DNA-methyltransferase (adenine-specific)
VAVTQVVTGPGYELRCGRWQKVLAGVEVDHLITDPPYGGRTHGNDQMEKRFGWRDLSYQQWGHREVEAFVDHWCGRVIGWMACMTSDDLAGHYRSSYECNGRLDFAPVPLLSHRPRLQGDGPGSGAVYLMVARPREKRFTGWGSLPCWYEYRPDAGMHIGGKPLALMRKLVRDYTRPGDLVCDPCAGGGTTLLAAVLEGRRAIGAEMDPDTFAKAAARLERETRDRVYVERPGEAPKMKQQALDLEAAQ